MTTQTVITLTPKADIQSGGCGCGCGCGCSK